MIPQIISLVSVTPQIFKWHRKNSKPNFLDKCYRFNVLQFSCVWFFNRYSIPFKSGQRISDFEAHWSAVSYLVSGVIDTVHHWSAVSLILPTTGQWYYWHRPPVVSGVIDTTGYKKFKLKVKCLGEFRIRIYTYIRNGSNTWVRGPDRVVWWKNQRLKISWQCPIYVPTVYY
jgi:hypothetical protein